MSTKDPKSGADWERFFEDWLKKQGLEVKCQPVYRSDGRHWKLTELGSKAKKKGDLNPDFLILARDGTKVIGEVLALERWDNDLLNPFVKELIKLTPAWRVTVTDYTYEDDLAIKDPKRLAEFIAREIDKRGSAENRVEFFIQRFGKEVEIINSYKELSSDPPQKIIGDFLEKGKLNVVALRAEGKGECTRSYSLISNNYLKKIEDSLIGKHGKILKYPSIMPENPFVLMVVFSNLMRWSHASFHIEELLYGRLKAYICVEKPMQVKNYRYEPKQEESYLIGSFGAEWARDLSAVVTCWVCEGGRETVVYHNPRAKNRLPLEVFEATPQFYHQSESGKLEWTKEPRAVITHRQTMEEIFGSLPQGFPTGGD